ncbi:vesicle-associated membrane protein-associated protein B-like [Acanthaster planci]|uniref:Vesicle-associated membrane protein-associated protein B-like n=1 Tax=Acanthaster planci TaxID=133434 RepID=A0A8B7XQP0_ACAPL|nr:vesicle-associated membrane protein-associated protein B-like [Acanthaster planci]
MSKLDQILEIDPPNELRFRGPFTEVVSSELKLSNPSEKTVCFKIKTTAPRRYCVRPNSGIVQPKESVKVSVMLQPFEYDPNEKNKHKFMVQSLIAPPGEVNQEEVWKTQESSALMDTKLKCVFELPASQATQAASVVEPGSGGKPAKAETQGKTAEKDLESVLEECRTLRQEVSNLRTENSSLRDGVRQRRAGGDSQMTSVQPSITETRVNNMPSVVALVVAILVGIIIGKVIL